MSLHISIPKIAITPEEDDDDDDTNLLNLAEALTDVEELFDDSVSTRRNSFKKKLKIKVTESDGYNTALEDVEGSDEDDSTPVIIEHECPISLENLDLEQFCTEENYGISQKRSNEFEYLNLQSSKTDDSLQARPSETQDVSILTEMEDYDTENEMEEIFMAVSEIHLDDSEDLQMTTITDEMQDKKHPDEENILECSTPLTPTVFPNTFSEEKEVRPPFRRPPTFSQMMKSKANAGHTRMRKRKRNKQHTRKFSEQKAENDSSENESTKREKFKNQRSTNSLNYESDVEEENKLQFPVCKKTFEKNKLHLKMPEFDVNDKTDVEDFEGDADTEKRRVSVDNSAFQNQLDEMASCYSFTKDKNETKVMKDEENLKIVRSDTNFDKKNIDGGKRERGEEPMGQALVPGNLLEEYGITNLEDVSHSEEPKAAEVLNQEVDSENDTEEELFKGLPSDMRVIPDLILPPPTRTLVISEETKSLIPTVRILPLDGNETSDSQCEEKSTDDESIKSITDLTVSGLRILRSPQLPIYEGENVKVSENSFQPLHNKSTIEDVATDVEYLDCEPPKPRKQIGMFLSPNNYTTGNLTDMEDLDMSDGRSLGESDKECHTDMEHSDSSDDDSFSKTELQRSKKFSLKLRNPFSNSRGHTDTEDLIGSSDDEINYSGAETATPHEIRREHDEICSTVDENLPETEEPTSDEVMYLKGGGSSELHTDTDGFFEVKTPIQDVMDAWEYFNNRKWSATEDIGKFSRSQSETVKEDLSVPSAKAIVIIPSLSYESILLDSKSSNPRIGHTQDKNSYKHIDTMLEKMLTEVDEIDKSLGGHTNSLKLEPSADALIEIPIRKSKSKKTYTATANIFVAEEDEFNELGENIMRYGDYPDTSKTEDAEFSSTEYLDYKDDMFFGDNPIAHEIAERIYEPIETQSPLDRYPSDSDYVWWEGTYRNLSVVEEEDEDNFSVSDTKPKFVEMNGNEMVETEPYIYNPSTSGENTDYGSECSQVFSSVDTDESDSDSCDPLLKAEVKLMITSHEDGLEAIEVKSVKEFMLQKVPRKSEGNDEMPKKKIKLRKKLMNMLDRQKSGSAIITPKKSDSLQKTKIALPSFILPRIFIKNSDAEGSASRLSDVRKSDIFAKPNDNFPLAMSQQIVDSKQLPRKIDLFENRPFFPIYNTATLTNSNSITYVPPSEVTISEGYCNWSSESEHHRGKTTSAQYLIELEETLQRKNIDSPDSAFPDSDTKKVPVQENVTDAFTHSNSESVEKKLSTIRSDVKTGTPKDCEKSKKENLSTDFKSITSTFVENERNLYDPFETNAESAKGKYFSIHLDLSTSQVAEAEDKSIIEKQDEETSKENISYECSTKYSDDISRNLEVFDNMKDRPTENAAVSAKICFAQPKYSGTGLKSMKEEKKTVDSSKIQDANDLYSIDLQDNRTHVTKKNDVEGRHLKKWSPAEMKNFTHEFVSKEIAHFEDVKFCTTNTKKCLNYENEIEKKVFSRAEDANISDNSGVEIRNNHVKTKELAAREIIPESNQKSTHVHQYKKITSEVEKVTSAFIAKEIEKYDYDVELVKPKDESDANQNIEVKGSTGWNKTEEDYADDELSSELIPEKPLLRAHEDDTIITKKRTGNPQIGTYSENLTHTISDNEKLTVEEEAAETWDMNMKEKTKKFLNMEMENYHDVKYHVNISKLKSDALKDCNIEKGTIVTDPNKFKTAVTHTEQKPKNKSIKEKTNNKTGKSGIFSFFRKKSKQNEEKTPEDQYEETVKMEDHSDDSASTKKAEKGELKNNSDSFSENKNIEDGGISNNFMSAKEGIKISGEFLSGEIEKYHDVRYSGYEQDKEAIDISMDSEDGYKAQSKNKNENFVDESITGIPGKPEKSGIMSLFKRKSSKETKKDPEMTDKINAKFKHGPPVVVLKKTDEHEEKLESEEIKHIKKNNFVSPNLGTPDSIELVENIAKIEKRNYQEITYSDKKRPVEESNIIEKMVTETQSENKNGTIEDRGNLEKLNTESSAFFSKEGYKQNDNEYLSEHREDNKIYTHALLIQKPEELIDENSAQQSIVEKKSDTKNNADDLSEAEKGNKIYTTTLNEQKLKEQLCEQQLRQSMDESRVITSDFLIKEVELYHDVKKMKFNIEVQHLNAHVEVKGNGNIIFRSPMERSGAATEITTQAGEIGHKKDDSAEKVHKSLSRKFGGDRKEFNSTDRKQETENEGIKEKNGQNINNAAGETTQNSSKDDQLSEEECGNISSALIDVTSSFLLEEKERYEDKVNESHLKSVYQILKDTTDLKAEPSMDKNTSDRVECQKQLIFEPVEHRISQSLSEIPVSSEYTVISNGNIKKTSQDEFVHQDRENKPNTQFFFEKEKNDECGISKVLKSTANSRSENSDILQSTGNGDYRNNSFPSKYKQTTTNFLILEKQFYDSEESNKEISDNIKKHKEIESINDGRKQSDGLHEKMISSDIMVGDKIAEKPENETALLTKSRRKKGILGFLKTKSKETEVNPTIEKLEKYLDGTTTKSAYPENHSATSRNATRSNSEKNEIEGGRGNTEDENMMKKKYKSEKKSRKEESPSKSLLGFLFKKKKSKDKDEIPSYEKVDDFLTILDDTKNFLNKETEMYHDMRDSDEIRNISGEGNNPKDRTVPSIIPEKKCSEVKISGGTRDFEEGRKRKNDYCDDERYIMSDEERDVSSRVDIPEYTSVDFIREEVEMFERTKIPNTNKVDSSIRIETEIENIDGEYPKEIITKKIIVSEKLIEQMDDSGGDEISQEILRKLMEVNEELKTQLNIEKSEKLSNFSVSDDRSESFDTVVERDVGNFEHNPQENITEIFEKEENEYRRNEFLERIEDVELSKSNIVEDVSLLEGLIHITKERRQEVVTDLDDITSDEVSSMDSRTVEDFEKISQKYPDCFNKNTEVQPEIDELQQLTTEKTTSVKEEALKIPGSVDDKNIKKKGSITKINEQGTLGEVIYTNEDFLTNLKLHYSQNMEGTKEQEIISKVEESIPFDEEKLTSSGAKRKPLFRIESEEENITTNVDVDSSEELDNLLRDLREDAGVKPEYFISKVRTNIEKGEDTVENVDIETIERKLCDLGKALETLEQMNEYSSPQPKVKNEVREGKLRRIERKFEHMASETDELATANKQTVELSKPSKNEQYQQLVSQLSQDEVMSFQGDYNNLWDEYTFSKSDEWDSKTPDSQADVLELPQGDIVYMAPVNLNKNHSVNKAGIEVDVIPIMPSPHMSPNLRKNRKRHRSTRGHDRHFSCSPQKHSKAYLQESITKKILEINPRIFLSRTAVDEDHSSNSNETLWMTRSLDDVSYTQRGPILNAVCSWLSTSSNRIFRLKSENGSSDSDEESKEQNESNYKNEDDRNSSETSLKESRRISINTYSVDTSCKELTDASQKFPTNIQPPQPKPRHQKSKEEIDEQDVVESPSKQISPVRDDLLDENNKIEDISYQDKKKFWENIAKEPSKPVELTKRNSVQEIGAPPVPKPRGTLQSSYSVVETITGKISPVGTTDVKVQSILKEKDSAEPGEVCKSTDSKLENKEKSESITVEETTKEVQKSDSVDTEENSSQAEDNAGYISDSGDVEHYISDSEIEDRVPQIRERQMSVFVPPSVSQRTRYERSASLPTEDLYEVSARSTKLRKQYYEEQIKKEMIQEQLTIDLEDDASPERKSISSPEMKLEETSAIACKEIPTNEKSDTIFESELEQYSEAVSKDGQRSLRPSKDEVHVDKSETEKSEKVFTSPEQKYQSDMQENIPEITFTLSGKQRRISEESEEDVVEEVEKISPVPEHPEAEEAHSPDVEIPEVSREHIEKNHEKRKQTESDEIEITDKQSADDSTNQKQSIEKTGTPKETHSYICSKSEFVSAKQDQSDAHKIEKTETSSYEEKMTMESETSANEISLHKETKLISKVEDDVEAKTLESSRTAAEEKLLAENILDDGIADIDLESQDLKNIVSRLESMHKFRKSKASTKIPVRKKVSVSVEKEGTDPLEKQSEIKCEVSKNMGVEKHEYHEKYSTENNENIQSFTRIKPIEGEIEETHFPQVDQTVQGTRTSTSGQIELLDSSTISLSNEDFHEVTKSEFSTESKSVSEEFEPPGKIEISKDLHEETSSPSGRIQGVIQDDTSTTLCDTMREKSTKGSKSTVESAKDDEGRSIDTPEYIHDSEGQEEADQELSTGMECKGPTQNDIEPKKAYIETEMEAKETFEKRTIAQKEVDSISCTKTIKTVSEEILSSKDSQNVLKTEMELTPAINQISFQKTPEDDEWSMEIDRAEDTQKVISSTAAELSSETAKTETKMSDYTVINQPQENIENTVWEVSIESEMLREEKLSSLPTSCKRESIDTKTDSTSDRINDDITTDETNLESEKIDQEPSDSIPSNRLELDSHDDMKKIILESLHQQKVDPEEAKMIANSLIEEIESELQKVENFNRGLSSKSESLDSEKHVTDYLKELAETKGLDQREVELVESVLERRKRQISKLIRGDTQASSMEITDEDLRYSETDYDYSNVLQQQMGQLEAEYSDHLKNVYDSLVRDQGDKESNDYLSSNKVEDKRNSIDKEQIIDEQLVSEKSFIERKDIILEEDENVTDDLELLKPKGTNKYSETAPDDTVIETHSHTSVIDNIEQLNSKEDIVQRKVEGVKKTDESIVVKDEGEDTSKAQTDVLSEELRQSEKYSMEEPEHVDKDNTKDSVKRTSSSDSKSSISSSKTPDDIYSTCSSGKKLDSEISTEVVFRKSKKYDEGSSKKAERKSGIELETYSSSGESHYHSFEIDTKSRPCSSDIEGIIPTGSSEYESALNSQELSMKSQVTSGEYHTAISSLSSKQSLMSIESESSGNLASIEVSETSETLVPTSSDLEGDMDMVDQQMFESEDLWQTSEFENQEPTSEEAVNEYSSTHSTEDAVDIPPKMKRSHEMTFQPEPRVMTTDSTHQESNDIEEKFGTSLDDGSALSVSLSSTSSAQLPTVIELSRTESGGHEESITSAFSDHLSLEDDFMSRTPENVVLTDSSTSTNSVLKEPIESVTILSATVTSNGISSVCSQVTTETVSSSTETQKSNHEELKRKGHRRQDSTSFIPTLIHGVVKSTEPTPLFQVIPHSQDNEDSHDTKVFMEKSEKECHDKVIDLSLRRESSERRDSHGKSSTTSSEKSSFEEAEAEAAFSMVAHISPVHKIKQICPIIEDIDAEKIESEARELAKRERIERVQQIRDASPGSIPDIKVTEHMAPLDESNFRYPELEIEREELERESRMSGTESPIPDIEQQLEDEPEEKVVEEPDSLEDNLCELEKTKPKEKPTVEEKITKEVSPVEKPSNEEERTSDSPNSDSFELVEKPDIIDDFVVIEEIGKEASEMDSEGKSMAIQTKPTSRKKRDEEIDAYLARSDPTPLTKMTELKYFPPDTNYDLEFEFEDSPPQAKDATTKDYGSKYDQELEANRKWIEQQFHGDQAAMAAAGYGYDMEFERGPLEDIKEEDINDIDLASSRIGSLGSQKESGGSLGSIKDSYSSTPEYDVLAGRRYFTRSGEHDDISMSSLQEFENLERAMSLETKKMYHGSGSQESSNGSFKTRYYTSKGQGDDISVSSLKEFEGLEKACIAVHRTEIKVKEEEELLSQIEEVQEIVPDKIEIDTTDKSKVAESDEEDYEKRMFEIDEIIRQAQNNVERFTDLKEAEKTESLGRGDSIEEVSKVPDLDLDAPLTKSAPRKDEDLMVASTDSLDLEPNKPIRYGSTDSLDEKIVGQDVMTASTDSIEFNNQLSKNITTDSMDNKTDGSNMVCSDSLEIAAAVSTRPQIDSLEEDDPKIFADHSSSDTGKDFSSSVRDDVDEQLHEMMLGSTDSLEPTSSTATHATYQYETDSVFSGSFTSGGSNTMVSSTDTIDPNIPRENIDIAAAVRKVWFDEGTSASGRNITTEFFEESSMPYVTEVIEPSDDPAFSHTIHRRVQMPVEVRKVTFHGGDAEEKLEQFIKDFGENEEEIHETEEVDADGNIHTRRVVQKRFIIKSDEEAANLSKVIRTEGEELPISRMFEMCPSQLTTLTKTVTGETSQPSDPPDTSSSKAQAFRRRPLRYDISVDDQTEVDPREHDWRFYLSKDDQHSLSSDKEDEHVRPFDQHQLSSEMKELLKEMEEASKK